MKRFVYFKSTKIRKLIYLSLTLLSITFLNWKANNPIYIVANTLTLISGFYFFYQNCYHVPKLFEQKKWRSFWLQNVLTFIILYFFTVILYTKYLADLGNDPFRFEYLLKITYPYTANTELPILYFLGLLFGQIKKQYTIKVLKMSFAFLLVGMIGFFIYGSTLNNSNKVGGIQILNQKFNSIEEIISLEEFKNKTVYIDLWYSSCSPCIDQMKNYLPKFKQEMQRFNIDLEYLYLGKETSHLHSKQLWKKTIDKYHLTGYHYYFSREDVKKIWKPILPTLNEKGKMAYAFPHYLIARNGKIIDYDAPNPEEVEKVKDIIIQSKRSL